MGTVVLFDPQASLSAQVQWAIWFARAENVRRERSEPVTILLPTAARQVKADAVRDQVAGLVAADQSACQLVALADDAAGTLLAAIAATEATLCVVLLQQFTSTDPRAACIGRDVLPKVPCEVAVVCLGDPGKWPLQHLLAPASRGAHPRAALQLAWHLAQVAGGQLTGAYVEPDIGTDASSVGEHVVDHVVRRALPRHASEVRRLVVVTEQRVEDGLAQACAQVSPDAVVLGVVPSWLLHGRFHGSVAARLAKRLGGTPCVLLRQPLPLGNRLRRAVEQLLQHRVPQIERGVRVELATRVQSSSAWNFDFVVLLSLATVIAALGLVQDSAPVIIGAMLIAPLMTPILGVGLALAQGNGKLARLAFRAIGLGVGTSLLLGLGLGLLDGCCDGPLLPTQQMLLRGSPGLIDLFVAFVSGVAAAYAYSRPGLTAALPGVAIAAALVPPIATSGLAISMGNWPLAAGAALLFGTNMVAIVLAAGFSLWVVGVRAQRDDGWRRHVGSGLTLVLVAFAVLLLFGASRDNAFELPRSVVRELERQLPADLRLIGVTAKHPGESSRSVAVTLQVGGPSASAGSVTSELCGALTDEVVSKLHTDVQLRIAFVAETMLPVAPGRSPAAGGSAADGKPDGKPEGQPGGKPR